MATQTVRCERHGESTRLSCVDCGQPLCPKCSVRTEVGLKCEACAKPAVETPSTFPRRRRLPLALGLVGLAIVGIAVALFLDSPQAGVEPVTAEPQGTWSPAAEPSSIRGTTVALPTGDGVLVAGGGVGAIPLTAGEIYDPQDEAWTATGELAQARRGHQGVVLDDGRVLVAGGFAEGEVLATVEIYDPGTRTWSMAEPMASPRLGHTLTVLDDGHVLATGGTGPEGAGGAGGGQTLRPQDSAEVYDPLADAWQSAGSMGAARFEHTATELGDGRVLIAGGMGGGGEELVALSSAELYDPATDTFLGTNAMADGRANHAAVALSDGRVLVVGGGGGERGDSSLATVEIFRTRQGSWEQASAMRGARRGATATRLDDGRVLVVGGELVQGGTRRSLDTAEVFDPAADEWAPAGSMSCPRSEHAAVLLDGGDVLVVAGDAAFPGEAPAAQSCVDRYQP
ncbi:MAG: kelch repeat-containing protein [Egibacteraceae bacterium]